ncbi:MAG: M14 family zinc carboxypeptidase [Planctomycetota bacterium]
MRVSKARCLLAVSLFAPISAQDFPPDVRRDPAVLSVRQILGHDVGESLTLHEEVLRCLEAFAGASPRARVIDLGKTWEGRPLRAIVLSSPRNLERLERIAEGMARLADPRDLSPGDERALLDELPATAWLAASVHGDETSGADALVELAWHLASAKDDPLVLEILGNCLVILDPVQNPDGRDRFVHGYRASSGLAPSADPFAAEHTQPWPGGRVNHYLFDLNRDWFALSQPETRARVAAFQRYWPLCFADLHEMGGDSTYYFAPPARPVNPEVTDAQRRWFERYGRGNAAWFDRFGFDYFTRESFDSFYPGYGDGWPTYHGSIGMTYEQGSARGLVYRRKDETLLTYRECVRHQFTAALATLETLAKAREEALMSFAAYRRNAVREGAEGPIRAFLFPDRGDRGRLARLLDLLAAQGVEVQRAVREIAVERARPHRGGEPERRTFPGGTYVVSLAQPAKHLASVLLQKDLKMDESFLKEQIEKQRRRHALDFYDLTAWSLPLLFDLETWVAEGPIEGEVEPVKAGRARAETPPLPEAKVAYAIPWDSNGAAALLVDLLAAGIRVRSLDRAFSIAGREFPPGSLVVRVGGDGQLAKDRLHALLAESAKKHSVPVAALDSSFVDSGPDFGSDRSLMVRRPRVALAWDRPVSPNSAGFARFLLERRYGLPVAPIRTAHLSRARLDRFTVLILPAGGGYADVLGKSGQEAISRWVDRGGVLIALGSASRWLAKAGLLASAPEDRTKPPKGDQGGKEHAEKKPAGEKPAGAADAMRAQGAGEPSSPEPAKREPPSEPFDYEKAILPDKEPPPRTPGAILSVTTDPEHWLAFGYRGHANVVMSSSDIYTPVKLDRGTNVAVYEKEDSLVLSGFVFDDAKRQLAQKAFLVHQPRGRGHVIAFAEDPNVRAFADGLNLMFLNAVLLTAGR